MIARDESSGGRDTGSETRGMAGRRGRRWWIVAAAIIAATGLLGWRVDDVRRYRSSLADAQADLDQGRYALAASKLTAITGWKPGADEAWFLLGTCEAARGRVGAAEEAWSRIPPESYFAPRAIHGRMQIELDAGRLAGAEAVVKGALADPRIDGASLPILLSPIYCQQGRLEETLRLLEARWKALDDKGEGASEPAVNLARAHAELRLNPIRREVIRGAFEHAASLAPDDDRVWLGRANLALQDRAPEESRRWLEACLRRRPDDATVWRSWLMWAIEAGQPAEVEKALEHLPAEGATLAEVRRIAWRAGRLVDARKERKAIERLITVDPANAPALARLAELTAQAGDASGAAEIRGRKAEVERLLDRYRFLQARVQPLRDAAEMSRLGLALGEWFEARAFLTLALAVDGERDEFGAAREALRAAPAALGPSSGSLAAAVAAEDAAIDESR
jgi:tetratricopeptide (TPR) repeat protein